MGAVRQAFGKNLAYHRERRGLTQARLAEMVESSPSYIGHLERGDREPSLLTIEELANALGIQAGEFFVLLDAGDERQRVEAELDELLRACSPDDVGMAVRLLRAALDHPRLRDPVPSAGRSPDGKVKATARPSARAGAKIPKSRSR